MRTLAGCSCGNIEYSHSLEMKGNCGIRSLVAVSEWMVAFLSWWALDGHCCFRMGCFLVE